MSRSHPQHPAQGPKHHSSPAIIRGMGHSYLNSQLLTVPVYLTGAVTIIIMARLADKMKLRSPFIVVSFFLQIIGQLLLQAIRPDR